MLTLDMSKYRLNPSDTKEDCAVYSLVLVNAAFAAIVDHFEKNRESILIGLRPALQSEPLTDDEILKMAFRKIMKDIQRMSLCEKIIELDPTGKAFEKTFKLIKHNCDETYKLCEEHGYILM